MTAPTIATWPVDAGFARAHGVQVTELADTRVFGLSFRRVQPVAPIVLDAPQGVIRPLSKRQTDVLELAAEGMPNSEIGIKLGVTEDTVKATLRAVYRKLHVSDRAGAVAVGFQLGWLA